MISRKKHIIGVDLIRVLAATLVVCYHFGFWNWTRGQPLARLLPGQAPPWGSELHFGWVGVEIFFVISGFVIAYSAFDTTAAAFLRSRLLRLAPASWIAATLVLFTQWSLAVQPPSGLLKVYVQTLFFWPFDAIDGVWWTLGVEIDFYLLVYLLIRCGGTALVEAVMVLIGLASGCFWIAALGLQRALQGQDGPLGVLHGLVIKAEGNRELQLLLVQHGCLFALGTIIWTISVHGLTRRRSVAAVSLAAACALEIVGQTGIIERASQSTGLSAWPALIVWSAAMGLLITSVYFNTALVGMFGRAGHAIRFVGLTTYPLYLVHNTIGIGVTVWLSSSIGIAAVGIGILLAYACAALISSFVEPRLRRLVAAAISMPNRIRGTA